MEHLPDEIVEQIFYSSIEWDSLIRRSTSSYKVIMYNFRGNPNSSHPIYNVSLTSRRMRRVSLPLLFESVEFLCPVYEMEEEFIIERFRALLMRGIRVAHLIRNASIDQASQYFGSSFIFRDLEQTFILEILTMCSRLKTFEIPSYYRDTLCPSPIPIIQAVNSHPSPHIQLIFPHAFEGKDDLRLSETDINAAHVSLSRVACKLWHVRANGLQKTSEYVHALVSKLGLRIIRIDGADDSIGWYKRTYPGLKSFESCSASGALTASDFARFLARHPLLDFISIKVHSNFPHGNAPWLIKLGEDMRPHGIRVTPFSSDTEVAARRYWSDGIEGRQWQLTRMSLEIYPSLLGGRDFLMRLGKAIPGIQVLKLVLPVNLRDFDALDVQTIISLFSKLRCLQILTLPQFIFDSIAREWCAATNRDFDQARHSQKAHDFIEVMPFCASFISALADALPSLHNVTVYIWNNIVKEDKYKNYFRCVMNNRLLQSGASMEFEVTVGFEEYVD